jgi:hypothetical protein
VSVVPPNGRRRRGVVIQSYSKETAYRSSSKNLGAIQRSDQKLWTFSAGTLFPSVLRPEQTSSAWSSDSMLLQGKQPTKTALKFWARYNDRSKVINLLSLYCGCVGGLTRTDFVGVE